MRKDFTQCRNTVTTAYAIQTLLEMATYNKSGVTSLTSKELIEFTPAYLRPKLALWFVAKQFSYVICTRQWKRRSRTVTQQKCLTNATKVNNTSPLNDTLHLFGWQFS